MIEIIEKIIPLVEGATNGAIWLVAAYFGLVALGYLLWFASFVILARCAYLLLLKLIPRNGVAVDDWRLYRVEGTGATVLFSSEDFKDLINAMVRDDGYIGRRDIRDAIEKIKGQGK